MLSKRHVDPGRRGWAASAGILAACGLVVAVAAIVGAPSPAAGAGSAVTPVPDAGPTVLPTFIGRAVRAHPMPAPGSPQNPFTMRNPYGFPHDDPWQSDTNPVAAGPLGRAPAVWSSNLAGARRNPSGNSFVCSTAVFDSHGRFEGSCLGAGETSLVLVDPVSLKLLAHFFLPTVPVDPYNPNVVGGAYFYLDSHDRAVVSTPERRIWVVAQTGPPAHPSFRKVADYDLSKVISAEDNINAIAPDWRGRIWFATSAATIGVLDPAKYPKPGAIHTLRLARDEKISNGPATTPNASYVVTSKKMYRVTAGSNGKPHVVWAKPYQTIGTVKSGQYSLGSGTSPTVLDHGRYVAITDNAEQLHVVVYRTAARLGPHQRRIVCQVPVFPLGHGATDDSLVGSGRSLVVQNSYGYTVNVNTLESTASTPGVARVDIDANGVGCHRVWYNRTLDDANTAPVLSTKTGLVYTFVRRRDPQHHFDVWYWTAVDFRTGRTVWQRLAGTGPNFDGWYPGMHIGPTGSLYLGAWGGLLALKDTR